MFRRSPNVRAGTAIENVFLLIALAIVYAICGAAGWLWHSPRPA
jgi:hypothetical protein